MSLDPHPPAAVVPPPARARVHQAVGRVSAELGADGVVPFIADGRFDRWVRGLVALDLQPGELLALRVAEPPRWVLAVLAELVGPTGRVWVVPAQGRAGVLWRWRCRGLGPAVRAASAVPKGVDALWCLAGGCRDAVPLGRAVREGGRLVLPWLHGGVRAPWIRVEQAPGRLTVDAAA